MAENKMAGYNDYVFTGALKNTTVSPDVPVESDTQQMIREECDSIKELLLEKNRKYGDSAINPKRLFSNATADEQILVRLDDKINRWINQQDDEDEDVIMDMIGYLILYRISKKK